MEKHGESWDNLKAPRGWGVSKGFGVNDDRISAELLKDSHPEAGELKNFLLSAKLLVYLFFYKLISFLPDEDDIGLKALQLQLVRLLFNRAQNPYQVSPLITVTISGLSRRLKTFAGTKPGKRKRHQEIFFSFTTSFANSSRTSFLMPSKNFIEPA